MHHQFKFDRMDSQGRGKKQFPNIDLSFYFLFYKTFLKNI